MDVVQLVRASDCGSECRGFEPHPPPSKKSLQTVGLQGFLFWGKGKERMVGRRGIWWKID